MTGSVMITGCSSGIGRETAIEFNKSGWKVHATSRNPEDIERLRDMGMDIHELDVTDPDEIDAVANSIESDDGLDCLVNNAGNGLFGAVEDISTEEMQYQFDVNVFGPHRLIKRFLPEMRRRENGRIINVSSVSGRISTPGQGSYAASKHALEALSDALRVEVDSFGIDVVLIEPGFIDTGFADSALEQLETEDGAYRELYKRMKKMKGSVVTPHGKPKDVAETIYNAATVDNPKPRYSVKRSFRLMRFAEHLPSRIRDEFLDQVLR